MIDTGLRASEVCRLLLDNLNLEDNVLRVGVKGGEVQLKVFTITTAEYIGAWLAIRKAHLRPPRPRNLFISIGGTTPGRDLTREGLLWIINDIGKRSGLAILSPHDLRRSFPTLSSRNGAPTRLVQIQGGWANLQLLTRYAQALEAEDFKPYSPMKAVTRRRES